MRLSTVSPAVFTLAALCCATAQGANFSDLKVVQEAAQSGMWTMTTTGMLPDGRPMPPRKNTVCATREQVIQSFSNPFMWNEKTGEEDKACPTTLTTNTSTLGVATMKCAAQTINLPGQKVELPTTPLSTEFKRVGSDNWTVTTGAVVTHVTYHGKATAGCTARR